MLVAIHTELDSEWHRVLTGSLGGATIVTRNDQEAALASVVLVDNPSWLELERYGAAEFVQSTFAGPDNLRVSGRPDGLVVARTSGGGLAVAMAEYVLACVMAAHRQAPYYRKAQNGAVWADSPGQPVAAKRTVGVLGFGELARPAAELLSSVGFRVIAAARTPRSGTVEVRTGTNGLSSVIAEAEILVNLLPLTPDTVGVLDASALATMPNQACLINCGRGPHLDLNALIELLDSGHISHAWLDVFDREPLDPSDPAWEHSGITITPHIAAESSPDLVGSQVVANIRRFLSGETPANLITALTESRSTE